jgi:hypothetical protein
MKNKSMDLTLEQMALITHADSENPIAGFPALSLTQPWATLCAISLPDDPAKDIETRSWMTNFYGEIWIHAAKTFPRWARDLCKEEPFRSRLRGLKAADLPLGAVLCRRSIYGCRRTEDLLAANWITPMERAFGDYGEGRWGFLLGPVLEILDPPILARGALGIWTWRREANAR